MLPISWLTVTLLSSGQLKAGAVGSATGADEVGEPLESGDADGEVPFPAPLAASVTVVTCAAAVLVVVVVVVAR